MKRFVNGIGVECEPDDAEIIQLGDRMVVRTAEGAHTAAAVRHGDTVHVSYLGRTFVVEKAKRVRASRGGADGELRAPMPGVIVDVLVSEGDAVQRGDKVVVLEAMKTQQPFTAPFAGRVATLKVAKGQQVAEGELLASVVPEDVP